MLDPRTLSDRRDAVVEACCHRGASCDVDAAIAAYEQLAQRQTELNELNRGRNEHQQAGKQQLAAEEREAHTAEGRRIKEEVGRAEAALAEARTELDARMIPIPNLVHPDSPVGGEEGYRVLREVGERRELGFAARDHLALAESLDLVDFEAGARVTGQKFYFLKNEAVLLEIGLQRFAVDLLREEGFTLYTTPDLARRSVVDGLAFSPRGPETQIYSVEGTDLDLIGTAEITLGGLYAGTIVDDADLPVKMAGISHCFRTEAGSAGRESKGLYRVHQFTKVEMFLLSRPGDSEAMHDELVGIEERVFQALEIPYRVIDVATGDLGAPAFRKFDIEAWMPGRGDAGDWGEVTSASNCTDYQARRLRIRFRKDKKNELVHTLNGTTIAITRTLIPLLENHQQEDGSISIPKALQPYVGLERIGPR